MIGLLLEIISLLVWELAHLFRADSSPRIARSCPTRKEISMNRYSAPSPVPRRVIVAAIVSSTIGLLLWGAVIMVFYDLLTH